MAGGSIVLSVELPGGPYDPADVVEAIRRSGGATVVSATGKGRSFDITFDYEGDEDDAATWNALCDVGAAYPGAVLASGAH